MHRNPKTLVLDILLTVTLLFTGAENIMAAGTEAIERHGPDRSEAASLAKIGHHAPGFTLDAVKNEAFTSVSLSDYRGKWVVLMFYPLDFTFVCPTEIRGFNAALPRFRELNAEFIAVSVDSKYSHLAWIKRGDLGKLEYPLVADFKKEVSRSYGILDEHSGAAQRGLFIIDPQGIIQYLVVQNGEVGRSVDETVRILSALQTGELCPLGWKPGQKTLGK